MGGRGSHDLAHVINPIITWRNPGQGQSLPSCENGLSALVRVVASIKNSVTVDWMHRDATRARMRVLVKKFLRKYGYPPDLQDAAVQTVLQQAEA